MNEHADIPGTGTVVAEADYPLRMRSLSAIIQQFAYHLDNDRADTRNAAMYSRMAKAMDDWNTHTFAWLQDGFARGILQKTEEYTENYAYDRLISIAEDDLSALEKASSQFEAYGLEESHCVCMADFLIHLAIQPAVERKWVGASWLFSCFDKNLQIRTFAFAPACMLNVPFAYSNSFFELAGIFHEAGHFVASYANVNGKRLRENVEPHLASLPTLVSDWFDEAFADAYSVRIGGPATPFWFTTELAVTPIKDPEHTGGMHGFSLDSGSHIPDSIRPFFFYKLVAIEYPHIAALLLQTWMDILRERGGLTPYITSILNGQVAQIPLDAILSPGLGLDEKYPLDRLAMIVWQLSTGCEQVVPADYGKVQAVDDIRQEFLNGLDALHIPFPFEGNQYDVDILPVEELLRQVIDETKDQKAGVNVREWQDVIEAKGYLAQHIRKDKKTMSVNWNGQPRPGMALWSGAQPDPGMALWSGAQPDPGMALWSGAQPDPGMALWSGGQPDPGMALWSGAQPDPGMALWSGGMPLWSGGQPDPGMALWSGGMPLWSGGKPQPGMALWSGGMPFRRMSEDGSPQASISLNSPWRLFLETDVLSGTEWIPYLPKPGKFQHGKYGEVNISSARNANFVKNFNDGVYQTQLPVDAEHNTKESGALGWINKMRMNADGSADAQVAWNTRGQQMLSEKRFKYVSPEFYDKWTDPATGKQYNDVAIGVALTTRPFFKESHLRPLIATERGIFTPEFQAAQPSAPPAPPVSPYRYGGRRMEEQPVEGGQANPQAVAELQQRFAELEAASAEAQARSLQLTEALDRSNRVIAEMQQAAQTRRFTDLVVGEKRWYGEVDSHLKVLRSFAETFGENSDEFQTYVQQQQALAEQLATSQLFAEYGHNKPGTKRTAADELDAKARTFQAEHAGMTYAQAYSEVLTQNPGLYDRYRKEG